MENGSTTQILAAESYGENQNNSHLTSMSGQKKMGTSILSAQYSSFTVVSLLFFPDVVICHAMKNAMDLSQHIFCRTGEDVNGMSFEGADEELLRRALSILEQRGSCTIFKGDTSSEDGIKFF